MDILIKAGSRILAHPHTAHLHNGSEFCAFHLVEVMVEFIRMFNKFRFILFDGQLHLDHHRVFCREYSLRCPYFHWTACSWSWWSWSVRGETCSLFLSLCTEQQFPFPSMSTYNGANLQFWMWWALEFTMQNWLVIEANSLIFISHYHRN